MKKHGFSSVLTAIFPGFVRPSYSPPNSIKFRNVVVKCLNPDLIVAKGKKYRRQGLGYSPRILRHCINFELLNISGVVMDKYLCAAILGSDQYHYLCRCGWAISTRHDIAWYVPYLVNETKDSGFESSGNPGSSCMKYIQRQRGTSPWPP